MAAKTFINLAVKDLNKTMDFFGKLGYSFNRKFTDEKAACMIISEECYVMLISESFFKNFIGNEISDATKYTEVIVSLSVEKREDVDETVRKAFSLGAGKAQEPMEYGSMYSWTFRDFDGHIWEMFWMDPEAMEKGTEVDE